MVKTENCLKALRWNATFQDSHWSAALQDRVSALIVLDQENVPGYAARVIAGDDEAAKQQDWMKCLEAAISREIEELKNRRGLFQAHSCMSAGKGRKDKKPSLPGPLHASPG